MGRVGCLKPEHAHPALAKRNIESARGQRGTVAAC